MEKTTTVSIRQSSSISYMEELSTVELENEQYYNHVFVSNQTEIVNYDYDWDYSVPTTFRIPK